MTPCICKAHLLVIKVPACEDDFYVAQGNAVEKTAFEALVAEEVLLSLYILKLNQGFGNAPWQTHANRSDCVVWEDCWVGLDYFCNMGTIWTLRKGQTNATTPAFSHHRVN